VFAAENSPADAGSLHRQVNRGELGQAVGEGDGFDIDVHRGGFQAVAPGGNGDCSGCERGARMATRLMPHSVSRKRLLVVLSLAALNPPRQVAGPVTEKTTRPHPSGNGGLGRPRPRSRSGPHRRRRPGGLAGRCGTVSFEALGRAGRLEFLLRNDLPALGGDGLEGAGERT